MACGVVCRRCEYGFGPACSCSLLRGPRGCACGGEGGRGPSAAWSRLAPPHAGGGEWTARMRARRGGAFAAGSVAFRGVSAPGPPHGQAARGTAGLLRALQAAPAGAAAASPQQRARAPSAERGSGRRTRRQAEAGGGRGAAGKASRAAGRQSSRGAKRCGGQAAEAGRARGAPGRADGGRKRRQAGRGTGGRPGNGAGSGAGREVPLSHPGWALRGGAPVRRCRPCRATCPRAAPAGSSSSRGVFSEAKKAVFLPTPVFL